MSSTPGRLSKSAYKRRQCANCAHNWMRHPKDEARAFLSPCNVTACICTRYAEFTVTRVGRSKVGAR